MPINAFLPRAHLKSRSRPKDNADPGKGAVLPHEILLDVFVALADRVRSNARIFYQRLSTGLVVLNDPSFVLRESISTLFSAILVSRSWCAVGTEFLYYYPVLTTPKQYRLFARTLSKSPRLGPCVQTAFIADIRAEPSFPLNILRHQDRDPKLLYSYLASIFTSCTSLNKLFISLQYPLSNRLAADWLQPAPIASLLTSLTISGWAFVPVFSKLSLPLLQILCLHGFLFQAHDAVTFPPFPKLHTLQLAHTSGWKAYHRIFGSIAALPSLTCLELYENDYQSSLAANEYSLPAFPHLRRLRAFGTYEYILFSTRWIESSTLSRVYDMGIGVADNGYDSLDEWEVPSTLETLTVAMRLDLPDSPEPQPKPLRNLLGFLQRNADSITRGSLREVIILGLTWHLDGPWSKEPIRAVVDEIEEFCGHQRVKLVLKRSMQNEWIEKEICGTPLPF